MAECANRALAFDGQNQKPIYLRGCAGLDPACLSAENGAPLGPSVSALVGPEMASENGRGYELRNDTVINVAGLLKEPLGARRTYRLHFDVFPLDDDVRAEAIDGEVKLTRLRDGIIVDVRAKGQVELECVRCLRPYDQDFTTEFAEEYRQTVDVRTGVGLASGEEVEHERFEIDEKHELDVRELLRQEIFVALPMRADCGAECPGPDVIETDDAAGDARFAALSRLLEEDPVR